MATSDFSTCDFENYRDIQFFQFYGSFSFKPTNLSYEIKCSKLVQTGFLSMIKYFIHITRVGTKYWPKIGKFFSRGVISNFKKAIYHISIILYYMYFNFENKIWFLIFKKTENFKRSTCGEF